MRALASNGGLPKKRDLFIRQLADRFTACPDFSRDFMIARPYVSDAIADSRLPIKFVSGSTQLAWPMNQLISQKHQLVPPSQNQV